MPVREVVHESRPAVALDDASPRRALPDVRTLGEVLAAAADLASAADVLGVAEPVLRSRLLGLHPAEKGFLRRRLRS